MYYVYSLQVSECWSNNIHNLHIVSEENAMNYLDPLLFISSHSKVILICTFKKSWNKFFKAKVGLTLNYNYSRNLTILLELLPTQRSHLLPLLVDPRSQPRLGSLSLCWQRLISSSLVVV
jgi:hypothetical protein